MDKRLSSNDDDCEGATRLDDVSGLKHDYIQTRDELNHAEFSNFIKAVEKYIPIFSGPKKVDFTYDNTGILKEWRNQSENRTTQGHKLKSSGKITEIFAVFLTRSDIELGINDGWVKDYNQGRNSGENAAERKVKYQINVEKIPKKFIIEID